MRFHVPVHLMEQWVNDNFCKSALALSPICVYFFFSFIAFVLFTNLFFSAFCRRYNFTFSIATWEPIVGQRALKLFSMWKLLQIAANDLSALNERIQMPLNQRARNGNWKCEKRWKEQMRVYVCVPLRRWAEIPYLHQWHFFSSYFRIV